MLLKPNKITIEVSNDGNENTTSLITNKDSNVIEVLTSLELAILNVQKSLSYYVDRNGIITKKELENLTYKDLGL